MRFPTKLPPDQSCPDCGSHEKRLPPSRMGHHHVYCDQCGYDFGRFDIVSSKVVHMLDALERKLGIAPSSKGADKPAEPPESAGTQHATGRPGKTPRP